MTQEEINDNYSPYCPTCNSCGESGCCSPLNCEFHEEGEYCEWYLKDLQFGYRMYRDLGKYIEDNFPKDSEINKEFDRLWDVNYQKTYENN